MSSKGITLQGIDSSWRSEVSNSIIEMGPKLYLLGVFDTAGYAQWIARAHTDYPFIRQGLQIIYALGTGTALEEMRLSKSRMREETDTGAEAMSCGSFL